MEQLLLHMLGDYITQTDWMAQNKTRKFNIAFLHALIYSLPFLLLRPSWTAMMVILMSHALIDHFRLVKYLIFAKNWTTNHKLKWKDCLATGYHKETPIWLATGLMIVTDNIMHLAINYMALKYL